MKKLASLFLVLVLAVTFIVCGKAPTEVTANPITAKEVGVTTEGLKPVRLGLIVQPMNNIFYVVLKDAAEAYAATLEGVEITVLDGKNIEEQIKVFEDFASTMPDAMGVAAIDATAMIPAINGAGELGVPVFCVDNNCPDAERESYIGTDNLLGAEEMAKWIIDRLGGEGKIAIVEGPGGSYNSNIRKEGLNNIFTTVENNIEIVARVTANWRRDEALNVTNDILTANPVQLDMVVALNDEMASGCMEAIKANNRQNGVQLIGYNGVPEAIKNVYEGGFQATVVQYPEVMAKTFIDNAVALVRDGVVPEQEILIPATVVDTELIRAVVDDNLKATNESEETLYAKLRQFYDGQ